MAGIGSAFGNIAQFAEPITQVANLGSQFAQIQAGQQAAQVQAQTLAAQSAMAMQTARYNAAIFARQSQLLQQDAAMARRDAADEANRRNRLSRLRVADAAAAFLGSGVTLEGTPLLLLENLALEGDKDVLAAVQSGYRQSLAKLNEASFVDAAAEGELYQARAQGSLNMQRASILTSTASRQATDSYIDFGSDLISFGADMYSRYKS